MNRYIDAELLLTDNTYEWFDDWGNYTSAGQAIVDAPTADVVEVVHGKWIPTGGEVLFLREFRCNRCKSRQLGNTNYCSNCGAKMDGKKVE